MDMTAPREQESDPRPADQSPEEEPVTADQDPGAETRAEEPEVLKELEEPSPEEVLRAERDAFQEKWLRVVAELDNVRKRSRREVADTRRFTQADILRSLLEVQDNFERALQSSGDPSDTGDSEGFREGIELIFQKFRGVLKDKGVKPMEAMGAEFDPNFHEAVGQLEREDTDPGLVIEVVQSGYHFGDMVLRPARVIISS
jgi:molecular chaperone GrpE